MGRELPASARAGPAPSLPARGDAGGAKGRGEKVRKEEGKGWRAGERGRGRKGEGRGGRKEKGLHFARGPDRERRGTRPPSAGFGAVDSKMTGPGRTKVS